MSTTTMNFPLYRKLLDDPSEKTLTFSEVCLLLNETTGIHCEIITALIVHHYIINSSILLAADGTAEDFQDKISIIIKQILPNNDNKDKKQTIRLPFKGKMLASSKSPLFTFRMLPPNLQKIIINYICVIKE